MKIIKSILLASIAMLFVACTGDDYTGDVPDNQPLQLKLLGKGTVEGVPTAFKDPVSGEDLEVACFTMEMFDANTGKLVGTLVDCELSLTEFDNGNILSRVVTTFELDGRGSITAENQVLQEPLNDEGLFSTKFDPQENNVIATSGEFKGRQGKASLDGSVDLSGFFDQGVVGFNCTFTIDLESY